MTFTSPAQSPPSLSSLLLFFFSTSYKTEMPHGTIPYYLLSSLFGLFTFFLLSIHYHRQLLRPVCPDAKIRQDQGGGAFDSYLGRLEQTGRPGRDGFYPVFCFPCRFGENESRRAGSLWRERGRVREGRGRRREGQNGMGGVDDDRWKSDGSFFRVPDGTHKLMLKRETDSERKKITVFHPLLFITD